MSIVRFQMVWALSAVFIAGCGRSKSDTETVQPARIIYHAVLLDSGQVYFGKLLDFGTPYPTLTDVFYIHGQSTSDPNQAKNLLIQRGNEWHKPDHMRINATHIVLIEPVAPDSKIGRLIQESRPNIQ